MMPAQIIPVISAVEAFVEKPDAATGELRCGELSVEQSRAERRNYFRHAGYASI